jgi:ribonuclease HII
MAEVAQKALFDREWTITVEREFFERGIRLIAGVDEVGRGALAGPVVTAAVILPPDVIIPGIRDSKQLTPSQREVLDAEIRGRAAAWSIDLIGNEDVDRLNVLEATRESMRRVIRKLSVRPEMVLTDAMEIEDLDIPLISLIKGDARSTCIGAASIIAKVWRDRWMCRAAAEFPAYGFDRHKGYGTRQHLEIIARQGSCPLHRKSFKPMSGKTGHGRHQ